MKYVCIVFILLISFNCCAEPLIHTPYNSNIFEHSWQEELLIQLGGLWNKLGRSILGGNIADRIKESQQNRENRIEESIYERMKETDPLWSTIIYENFPHKLQHYRDIEKYAKDSQDLSALIEHIREQKSKLKNEFARRRYQEYIDDLEHIRDYQKEIEGQQLLNTATITTITMAIIAVLIKIAGLLAGVPV